MKMEVRGTQVKGRPRMRWMDNIRHDRNQHILEVRDSQGRKRLKALSYELKSS